MSRESEELESFQQEESEIQSDSIFKEAFGYESDTVPHDVDSLEDWAREFLESYKRCLRKRIAIQVLRPNYSADNIELIARILAKKNKADYELSPDYFDEIARDILKALRPSERVDLETESEKL